MRVYMQMPSLEGRPPKFYHLMLQKDLLGGWSLVKEWGNQGARGKVKLEHFEDWESAEAALASSRNFQIKRGYQVVFVQGQQEYGAD